MKSGNEICPIPYETASRRSTGVRNLPIFIRDTALFHCDSVTHKVILHSITMKYAVSRKNASPIYATAQSLYYFGDYCFSCLQLLFFVFVFVFVFFFDKYFPRLVFKSTSRRLVFNKPQDIPKAPRKTHVQVLKSSSSVRWPKLNPTNKHAQNRHFSSSDHFCRV